MKIRPVGAELFHADRRTDRHMTKLMVAFRNFSNAPKKLPFVSVWVTSLIREMECSMYAVMTTAIIQASVVVHLLCKINYEVDSYAAKRGVELSPKYKPCNSKHLANKPINLKVINVQQSAINP